MPDQKPATYPAVCPICQQSIDVPSQLVAVDGSYSYKCTKCQQSISGTLSSDPPANN
jgi:transposase-like protein